MTQAATPSEAASTVSNRDDSTSDASHPEQTSLKVETTASSKELVPGSHHSVNSGQESDDSPPNKTITKQIGKAGAHESIT